MAPLPQLTSRDRRALRTHVLRELDRLDAEVVALTEPGSDASAGAVEALRTERASMRATLDRVDDLAYGVCEVCRRFIGIDRLMALPSTSRCIDCTRRPVS